MNSYPSIFNDVIGPVMRGPSSSHCAASLRIGRLCRDLMSEKINHILIEFDPKGSLATTHKSQGSDMGLFGGFLGWEAFDERLPESERYINLAGITVEIEILDIGASHPNTYRITLSNKEESRRITAISTGGGMIEVISIDGAEVSMAGDFCETLIYCKSPESLLPFLKGSLDYDELSVHSGDLPFIEIKSQQFPDTAICQELMATGQVLFIKKLSPVLPVMARKDLRVPFITCAGMLDFNQDKGMDLWELAVTYESARGNITHQEVMEKMLAIVRIMDQSIQSGLRGTKYADRILGSQSVQLQKQLNNNRLIGGDVNNTIIMYVSAMMEVKSSMGVIVAAPTAGSCGALPGAIFGTASSLHMTEEDTVKAMLAAGLIGVFIAAHATFAAEVGGCMAECGSGSGMAAAALVGMAKGSLLQSIAAASLALQNSLGLICDPIGNRVEAPCLGRNVMAATNAVSCANMALSDYDHLISLDEVIETMQKVGNEIHHTLRCTNLGGLSVTRAAKKIEEKLNEQPQSFFKSC
ncbi:MAG: L-serine ammonia-lyase, iron-sulfur-dependent, subunit alpha [Bacteroidota bacterium]|nr:L-serine ammonia-lyase, iron-sulfur-dependent, subunit alpha [Bacteroidota bacterium]MDP4212342.1 L-serine ammonia-lyase, iron-sulfur-dependent, subunit alpha [Bacteroidota bacterium]MDP4249686.1 L-serine ammonia-lyase, iron-sulfur-dependent, subunit alpha [Bacteroidota bacterium]